VDGDLICILYGCNAPVVLREDLKRYRTSSTETDSDDSKSLNESKVSKAGRRRRKIEEPLDSYDKAQWKFVDAFMFMA
jgi:hypothetical protein